MSNNVFDYRVYREGNNLCLDAYENITGENKKTNLTIDLEGEFLSPEILMLHVCYTFEKLGVCIKKEYDKLLEENND